MRKGLFLFIVFLAAWLLLFLPARPLSTVDSVVPLRCTTVIEPLSRSAMLPARVATTCLHTTRSQDH